MKHNYHFGFYIILRLQTSNNKQSKINRNVKLAIGRLWITYDLSVNALKSAIVKTIIINNLWIFKYSVWDLCILM